MTKPSLCIHRLWSCMICDHVGGYSRETLFAHGQSTEPHRLDAVRPRTLGPDLDPIPVEDDNE